MKRFLWLLLLFLQYPRVAGANQDVVSGVKWIASRILMRPSAPHITTTSVPQGEIALAYSTTFTATGGHLPYSWSISSGTLPSGLTFGTSGVLSGTPQSAGTTFTARVTDWSGRTAQQAYTISIAPKLVITTDTCPPGEVGVPYSCQIVGSGGVPPYKCIADKPLPPGLTLDSAKCLITGVPTQAGSFVF